MSKLIGVLLLVGAIHLAATAQETSKGATMKKIGPLMTVVDMDIGESTEVTLSNGHKITVKLLGLNEQTFPKGGPIRSAVVELEIDGKLVNVSSANYNLPMTVGKVQVDCAVTRGYQKRSRRGRWALDKAARLRFWPAGSPWIRPNTFRFPTKQAMLAFESQMSNEPVFVNAGDRPTSKNTYYHEGLDFGGVEGKDEVVAATDGVLVLVGMKVMEGAETSFARKQRRDVVYVRDDRGWYYRYSHLYQIDPSLKVGARVAMGDRIGILGKEGGSGGWAHLHFDVSMKQPSGRFGTSDGYAFLVEAARHQHKRVMVACARPHQMAWTGEPVTLDASRSWHRDGADHIKRYEWRFSEGATSTGLRAERTYTKPGYYSEILKLVDDKGRVDYDFAVVHVYDKDQPKVVPPTIHAAFWPSQGLRAGDTVTFKARAFAIGHDEGRETWDFDDGSPAAHTQSDGNQSKHAKNGYGVTTHVFEKPGHYIVSVSRTNDKGLKATARLHVEVAPAGKK